MPYPGWLHPEPLPQQQFTADPYLCRRHSNTVLSQSLWGLLVCTEVLFEPSEHISCVWGLILNVISPLLPSCRASLLRLDVGYLFLMGIQHSPIEGCSAAAKSLQSCPTLCDPIDGSPPGSLVPGILQARTLEWVAISFSNA